MVLHDGTGAPCWTGAGYPLEVAGVHLKCHPCSNRLHSQVIVGASYCTGAACFTGVAYCAGAGAAKLSAFAGEMYFTNVAFAAYTVGAGLSAMLTVAGAGLTYSTNGDGAENPAVAGELYSMTGIVSA